MDEVYLSDTLHRFISDVFLCYDEDNSGKASISKTVELIRTGNVSEDAILQISDICWGHNASYVNRKQFFSAMKLVAAYQANVPIESEVLGSRVELPLPRFTWTNVSSSAENSSKSPELLTFGAVPVPDLIELQRDVNSYIEQIDSVSTDSGAESETLRNGSPDMSSNASDSPTPTNSVQDRSWAVTSTWHGLISEEQRQLLGTEEESSDRHSSEEDTEVSNEVWTITPEQREYYANQFKSLQPDANALLAGPVARMFFEKSRLPVNELRKIWQLADVTKDGALSLQEFNTAMHLVVLRRNHIELPEVLPQSLVPGEETPVSLSPETEPILSPQLTKETAKEWTKFVDSPTSSVSSPGPKPVNFDFQKVTSDKDSKILHPVPLRVTPEVNNQLEEQPENDLLQSPKKFIEPQNLTTPNSTSQNNNNNNSAIQRPQPKKISVPGPGAIPPPPPSSTNNQQEEGPVSLPAFPPPKKDKPPPPPPPPRPFKSHGRSSSLDLNKLTKLGAPPTVPPRVSPSIQSGKKLINQRSEGDCVPVVGAQAQAAVDFADFDRFEKYENVTEDIFPGEVYEAERRKIFARFCATAPPTTTSTNTSATTTATTTTTSSDGGCDEAAPRKHGAFEVYRKPQQAAKSGGRESPEEWAKWELFKRLQEENSALLRLCQELSQELVELKEEKLRLKVRLEKQINGG